METLEPDSPDSSVLEAYIEPVRLGQADRPFSARYVDGEFFGKTCWQPLDTEENLLGVETHHEGPILQEPSSLKRKIWGFRLKPAYLIYCLMGLFVSTLLLIFNLWKYWTSGGDVSQWKHSWWEEVTEILLTVFFVLETHATMYVMGLREFFTNVWYVADFFVLMLAYISLIYAFNNIQNDWTEAELPFLVLRFLLQPSRVIILLRSSYLVRRLHRDVTLLSPLP